MESGCKKSIPKNSIQIVKREREAIFGLCLVLSSTCLAQPLFTNAMLLSRLGASGCTATISATSSRIQLAQNKVALNSLRNRFGVGAVQLQSSCSLDVSRALILCRPPTNLSARQFASSSTSDPSSGKMAWQSSGTTNASLVKNLAKVSRLSLLAQTWCRSDKRRFPNALNADDSIQRFATQSTDDSFHSNLCSSCRLLLLRMASSNRRKFRMRCFPSIEATFAS